MTAVVIGIGGGAATASAGSAPAHQDTHSQVGPHVTPVQPSASVHLLQTGVMNPATQSALSQMLVNGNNQMGD